jgi:hypothetical protein
VDELNCRLSRVIGAADVLSRVLFVCHDDCLMKNTACV